MPKSRKRRPKTTKRRTPLPTKAAEPSSPAPPVLGAFSSSRSLGIGLATDDDWNRLRQEFLREYPVCPDCGAPWDLDVAGEEEGLDFDAQTEITLSVTCSAYEDDLEAGKEPRPHKRASDGFMQYAITLAGPTEQDAG